MRSSSSRIPIALASAIAVSCASAPRTPKQCDAKEEVIDAYLGRVAARASGQLSPIALGRSEQVTVAFEIAPSGAPERISVVTASTPLAAEAARDAVKRAGPYTPPPFSQKACLLVGRIVVSLYSTAKCDPGLAEAYVDSVSTAVRRAMDEKQMEPSSPEANVVLRVDIARDGSLEDVLVQVDDDARSGGAIAALARSLSPFTAPDGAIVECVADMPFFLWFGATAPTPL